MAHAGRAPRRLSHHASMGGLHTWEEEESVHTIIRHLCCLWHRQPGPWAIHETSSSPRSLAGLRLAMAEE